MGRRTRFLGVSSTGGSAIGAAWAAAKPRHSDGHYLFISKHGGIEVASYSVADDRLQNEVSMLELEVAPQKIVVHPGGVILCTFPNSCSLMEVDYTGSIRLQYSQEMPALRDVGALSCVVFSIDGSRVAFGGKDGSLRVLEWPSLRTIIHEPHAHKSIKDLDFSLDGALLASTSDDGPCRIWDLDKGTTLQSLHHNKDERFGFCRFSKHGAHPFLFLTVNKDDKGFIAVWEIVKWNKLGSKEFHEDRITSFAMSADGKRLAIGTKGGDVAVIEVTKMVLRHKVKGAHIAEVTHVEFSPDSRALLSTSMNSDVRVSATHIPAEWKDWQIYLLLAGLVLMSALLFYVFFQYSDSFWKFPVGSRIDHAKRSKWM